jgi:hypothetical protein
MQLEEGAVLNGTVEMGEAGLDPGRTVSPGPDAVEAEPDSSAVA